MTSHSKQSNSNGIVMPLTAAVWLSDAHARLTTISSEAAFAISAFLDPTPRISVNRVAVLGSVRLLDPFVAYNSGKGGHPLVVEAWLLKVVREAAHFGHLTLVRHIVTYHEVDSRTCLEQVACGAVDCGRLELVQWLARETEFGVDGCVALTKETPVWALQQCRTLWARVYDGQSVNGPFEVDDIFVYLASCSPHLCTASMLSKMVFHGRLNVVEMLLAQCPELEDVVDRTITDARRSGDAALMARVCALAYAQYQQPDVNTTTSTDHGISIRVIFGFHRDMMDWFNSQSCAGWREHAINVAAASGHLDIVQWAHEHRVGGCSTVAMDHAASEGHLAVMQWLHDHRTEGCTVNATDGAAKHGHLAVVQWLHEHRSEGWTERAMSGAARNGHLHVLQWLHEHRTEAWTTDVMNEAATNGHLDVVQWLHEYRTEGCTTIAMDYAAAMGHLNVVQWLHEYRAEGCTTIAMDNAAARNHLDVVHWLHEHRLEGCTASAFANAAVSGHVKVVEWLVVHRAVALMPLSFSREHLQRITSLTASQGHISTVMLLNGMILDGWTTDAMDGAAANGKLTTVKWLQRHRLEGCTDQGIGRT